MGFELSLSQHDAVTLMPAETLGALKLQTQLQEM